ncbi:MAG TPA: hypothetical protein VHX44_09985 [Planctomycetota bacterium]|nr:hypothetical protein [Planctomycetota bacterium]
MITVTRRTLLAVVAPAGLILLLMSGCGDARGVNTTEVDLVAWFIEDLVHGNPRNPQELVLPNSSEEMERIATWLAGGTVRDQYLPPRQVADRRDRWPALKALFRQGQAVVLDDGLVAANPLVSKDDQAYALPIIDAENLDRRAINALLISMSKAERPEAKVWLARAAEARITLDTQGGAKRWVGKY